MKQNGQTKSVYRRSVTLIDELPRFALAKARAVRRLVEADEHEVFSEDDGTLDELPVFRERIERLLFGHRREPLAEAALSVTFTARVEEPFQGEPALFERTAKLHLRRRVRRDVDRIELDIVLREERERLTTGRALGVLVNLGRHGGRSIPEARMRRPSQYVPSRTCRICGADAKFSPQS